MPLTDTTLGSYVYEDIAAVVRTARAHTPPRIVKVIFETSLLSQHEIIDASVR